MTFHLEILSPEQCDAMARLSGEVTASGFYLAGGTALAIYLGHRKSVDLDWFTSGSIGDVLEFSKKLIEHGIPIEVEDVGKGTLHGTVSGVNTTFLEFHYPVLDPLVGCEPLGCNLASVNDIACMKLSALAQRGARKDFVDLYALVRGCIPYGELLRLYQRKFGVKDLGHVLYASAYFDDAEREAMPAMIWRDSWPEMKISIQKWVKGFSG